MRFGVRSLETFERQAGPVREAVVRARIRLDDGREAEGVASAPLDFAWFDRGAPDAASLLASLALARDAYLAGSENTAFGHFIEAYGPQIALGATQGLGSLVACFGPALVDRALLDALCRVLELSFFEAVRRNVPGLAAPGWQADLLAFDFDAFLASLDPSRAPRPFTIELAGEVAADLDRLQAVAAAPEGTQPFHDVALDARGRFDAAEPLLEIHAKLQALPALRPLAQKLRYIEQPIRPSLALSLDVSELAERVPLVLDESDDSLEAFPRARRLGYTGVTARAGKGLYGALLNAARCSLWNAEEGASRYFVVGLGELAGPQVPAHEENSIP